MTTLAKLQRIGIWIMRIELERNLDMKTFLLKRGRTTNRRLYTPLSGELIFDTDERALYVGDGVKSGGYKVAEVIQLPENPALYAKVNGVLITLGVPNANES